MKCQCRCKALLLLCSTFAAALNTSISIHGLTLTAEISADDASLSETFTGGVRDNTGVELLSYHGPRVVPPTAGTPVPEIRWLSLTRGGTPSAPSITARGTLVLAARPAQPAHNTIELHTDRMGDDYRKFVMPNASSPATDCQAACVAESQTGGVSANGFSHPPCRGWTWTCPGMQGPLPVCWLKSAAATATHSDCPTSGTVTPAQPALPAATVSLERTVRLRPRTGVGGGGIVEVQHNLSCPPDSAQGCAFSSFEDVFKVWLGRDNWAGAAPDVAWSQSIKRTDEDAVPHWNFKSPALVVQEQTYLAALVADLPPGVLSAADLEQRPLLLDLVNPSPNDNTTARGDAPTMSYGFAQSLLTSHSVYSRTPQVPVTLLPNTTGTLAYTLLLDCEAPDATRGGALGKVASLLWDRMGRHALLSAPHQQRNAVGVKNASLDLFDKWRRHAWLDVAPSVYFEFPCNGGAAMGLNCSSLATERVQFSQHLATKRDFWLNAWFMAPRQALGMFRYGIAAGDAQMQHRALGSLLLALEAPQDPGRGAFPSIFWLGDDNVTQNWIGDSGWAGLCNTQGSAVPTNCTSFYHVIDMAWAGYWLLQWRREPGLPTTVTSRIDSFVGRLAEFIAGHAQQHTPLPLPSDPVNGANGGGDLNGGIPAWFSFDSLKPRPEMRFNAETATAALFLAEAHAAGLAPGVNSSAPARSWLAAAGEALDFVEREIVPSMRWSDFETFVSCSHKEFDFFDHRTNQHPQNNLAMIYAAMAELRVFELTANVSRLEWGERILGRLSLTQAVWSHPALTPVLSGGFTTQNTDAEWTDARTALCAVLYLDYYFAADAAGTPRKLEYLERAVAALRSPFAVAPYENYAHTGGQQGDIVGALSSAAHWGTCSAATSVELTRAKLRDLYVYLGDVPHGACVNGCTLQALSWSASTQLGASLAPASVSLNITTPFDWNDAPFVAIIDGPSGTFPPQEGIEVLLNGKSCGVFHGDSLKKGVTLPSALLKQHDI